MKSHHMTNQERSCDVADVVEKRDCCLISFVKNIRYLVGTSDITTVSKDQGNILQTACRTLLKKKRVLLYNGNVWFGAHVMFLVILKRCCRFSVV